MFQQKIGILNMVSPGARIVMMDRETFLKRRKRLIERPGAQADGREV